MKRSTPILTALVALPAVLLTAGCAASTPAADAAGTDEPHTIRLAATSPLAWPQAHVATAEDGWDEAGVALEQTEFATGREALQALLGGGADIAEVSASNVVSAAYSGNEVVVLARGGSWGTWSVISNAASGITEADDLVGKRVGVTIGTSSQISLSSFLTENGVDVGAVELVNVAPPDMANALATGSVDAVNPWQPTATQTIEQMGDDAAELPYQYTQNYLLATTPEFLEENPEAVTAFLEGYASADEILGSRPDEAAAAVTEAAQISPDALVALWDVYEFRTEPADADVVAEMTDVAKLLEANGDVSGEMPDFEAMFYTW